MGVTGVGVSEGVTVIVTVGVAVASTAAVDCPLRARYTIPAPIARKTARRSKATGKLNVTCGIRLPRTAFSSGAGASPPLPSSAPQTGQRAASSLTRVPQVGQSFVFWGEFSVISVHAAPLIFVPGAGTAAIIPAFAITFQC